MAALVRPPVLCAVTGGGGKDKWAPQPPRWGRNKPSLPHQPRQSGGNGGRGGGGGGALDQVLGVLRRDGEFLQAAAGAPLRDVLWLRFLEKEKQQQREQPKPEPKPSQRQQILQQQQKEEPACEAPAFPPPSYPPGSSPPTRAHHNSTQLHTHRLVADDISPHFGRVVVRRAHDG
jgi:aarF domain-containing kinase